MIGPSPLPKGPSPATRFFARRRKWKSRRFKHPEPEPDKTWKARHVQPTEIRRKRDPLFNLVKQDIEIVVEIGAKWGWLTRRLAEYLPKALIFAQDTWSDKVRRHVLRKHFRVVSGDRDYLEWVRNVGDQVGKRVLPFRMDSEELAKKFDLKADFVILQGQTNAKQVERDIRAWQKHLKPGGVLMGRGWNLPFVQEGVNKCWKKTEFQVAPLFGRENPEPCYWRMF